jgi:hypothetical protein
MLACSKHKYTVDRDNQLLRYGNKHNRKVHSFLDLMKLFLYVKTEINGRGNSLRWPRNTLYLQKLALTSPTSGGRSVGIVLLRTKATEFSFLVLEIYV